MLPFRDHRRLFCKRVSLMPAVGDNSSNTSTEESQHWWTPCPCPRSRIASHFSTDCTSSNFADIRVSATEGRDLLRPPDSHLVCFRLHCTSSHKQEKTAMTLYYHGTLTGMSEPNYHYNVYLLATCWHKWILESPFHKQRMQLLPA